jgi:cellulase/cellobiase CelA1
VGRITYPAVCGGNITVRALGASTPAAVVGFEPTGTTLTGLTPGSTTTWVVLYTKGGFDYRELNRVTVTQPGGSGATRSATAHLDSVWDDGFVATVTVTNTAATAIGRWSVVGTLPAGVRLVNAWSATTSLVGGTLTATNAAWNGTVAPGASTTFGLQAARSGGGTVAVPSLTCSTTAP